MQKDFCVICKAKLPEKRLQQGKCTCCKSCQLKYVWLQPEYRQSVIASIKQHWTDEQREKQSNKLKKTHSSKEMRLRISEAVKQAFTNPEVRQKQKLNTKKALANPEVRQKMSMNIKRAYKEQAVRQKASEAQKRRWSSKEARVEQSIKIKKAFDAQNTRHKISLSLIEAHKNPEYLQKVNETKRRHNSYKTSKSADECHQLLVNAGYTVFREFYYPSTKLKCDEYIKELDLYIELHFYWTHGKESFDRANEKHIDTVEYWKKRSSTHETPNKNEFKTAIYTWTDLDVRKRLVASQQNLNYKCFYSKEDFMQWYTKFLLKETQQ